MHKQLKLIRWHQIGVIDDVFFNTNLKLELVKKYGPLAKVLSFKNPADFTIRTLSAGS